MVGLVVIPNRPRSRTVRNQVSFSFLFLFFFSFRACYLGLASGIKLNQDPVDTPTDMSCYTPEPDDRSTALSPMPEIPNDPRELQAIRFPSLKK